MKVAIMGNGSWGTGFGMVMADAGAQVHLWGREEQVCEDINANHVNSAYHPGVALPTSMSSSTDAAAVLKSASIIVLAIPSQTVRENLAVWKELIEPDAVVVSLMKGIELGTVMRMSEVIREVAELSESRVAVISGPNLAREIAMRQPAATTVACADPDVAQMLADRTTTAYFRPYWTTDVIGTEIGGSVKNVIALANGMAVGLGFGENAQASLITRGLAEMSRLGASLGAQPMTFLGLAGIGDLIATCTSPLSRNRTFGENLGKGLSVDETTAKTKQTCEGVKSCQSILDLATRHGVEMPITEQVVHVVRDGMSPRDVLANLMSRDTKAEQGNPH